MDWGMKNRLSRILKPATGRTVMLAIDHGYFLGPTGGLEAPGETVEPLLPHADSLMLTRGTLRQCIPAESEIPIVLRVSGGTSILTELSHEGLTVAMEDAIRLNAAAITLSVFVGAASASANRPTVAYRSAGSRASARPIAASTCIGTISLVSRTCGTGSVRTLAMIACALGPVWGGSPTSIS